MQTADFYSNQSVKAKLLEKVGCRERLIGVAAGSGITGKYTVLGGCDMILALSSGKYRSMGCGSMAGFMCYGNSNDLVMDFAQRELLRYREQVPVFFGLNATDPTKEMYDYIKQIRDVGFAGIVNYPTVGMIDGVFRRALEQDGVRYEQEVEAISLAHYCGLLTIAFVFDAAQAEQMLQAGADIICAHFGLTSGGYIGAKKTLTLEKARLTAREIFSAVDSYGQDTIKMIYGGPVKTPIEAEYMYQGSGCQGYIGGSVFERTPVESALLHVMEEFKAEVQVVPSNRLERILFETPGHYNYIDFICEYIDENYMNDIHLVELAQSIHLSPSYLSSLFKKNIGTSFQNYLIDIRMHKAEEMIRTGDYPLVQVAQLVGYQDYAQFSKMYKKVHGYSLRLTRSQEDKTN